MSVTNTGLDGKPITLSFDSDTGLRTLLGYTMRQTDATYDDEQVADETLDDGTTAISITLPPASINTFAVTLGLAVDADEGVTDAVATLAAPAPNPAVGSTTLAYRLASPGLATLSVFDVRGREVARVADGVQAQGEHRPRFDTSALAAGVYVVRLQTTDGVETQQMVVVR